MMRLPVGAGGAREAGDRQRGILKQAVGNFIWTSLQAGSSMKPQIPSESNIHAVFEIMP